MSYDVRVEADLGGEEPMVSESLDYTSNCAGMWRAAGLRLRDLDGRPASEVAAAIGEALARLRADPERYEVSNPPNGWGSYDRGVEWLVRVRGLCLRYPRATFRVC